MDAEEQIQKYQNIIIVFFTESNASSFIISELVRELESDYGGRIKVIFVDADDSPKLADRYGIRKIPTLVFIKNEEVMATLQGISTRSEIINTIKTVFLENK
jgi:thioredoxin-like negative regulator of GroEL